MGKRAAVKNETPQYDFAELGKMLDEMQAELGGENWSVVSSDIVGFWDPEVCPIACIPRRANVADSQLDPKKPSLLIFAELLKALPLYKIDSKTKERVEVTGKPGDLIGIWAKPGMRDIRALRDVPVLMAAVGTKDTGMPNEMVEFLIKCPRAGEGKPLQIVEDRREKSKGAATFLERRQASKVGQPAGADDFAGTDGEDRF